MKGITITFSGLEGLEKSITNLEKKAPSVASKALYEGAGMMADAITAQAQAIQTEPFRWVPEGGDLRLPSPEEKEIMLTAAAGITKFEKTGDSIQTSIGYGAGDGYATVHYAGGKSRTVAVAEIARSINRGTSFMRGQPFIERGIAAARSAAESHIQHTIDSELYKLANG